MYLKTLIDRNADPGCVIARGMFKKYKRALKVYFTKHYGTDDLVFIKLKDTVMGEYGRIVRRDTAYDYIELYLLHSYGMNPPKSLEIEVMKLMQDIVNIDDL